MGVVDGVGKLGVKESMKKKKVYISIISFIILISYLLLSVSFRQWERYEHATRPGHRTEDSIIYQESVQRMRIWNVIMYISLGNLILMPICAIPIYRYIAKMESKSIGR